jgi:antagonist of KipI
VQVPNDGMPIVLLADHQTTGGYPKIAEVAGADMPALAQLAPGARVRFARCSVEEAQRAEDEKLARLKAVKNAIGERLGC